MFGDGYALIEAPLTRAEAEKGAASMVLFGI